MGDVGWDFSDGWAYLDFFQGCVTAIFGQEGGSVCITEEEAMHLRDALDRWINEGGK